VETSDLLRPVNRPETCVTPSECSGSVRNTPRIRGQKSFASGIVRTLLLGSLVKALRLRRFFAETRSALLSGGDGVKKPVYDIVDCGPRNRFCTPFAVAHNCLGLGYGCGADKFKIVAKTMAGLDLDPAACKATVYDFRNNNPGITNLWAQHQYALSVSADQKDSTHEIELASGRILTYFNPRRVIDSKTGRSGFTVMFRKGENPRYVYGGLLCIAEGTPVLTDRGWVGIEDVLETDLVWDGQSWVEQDGPVCNGVADTVEAYGAFMTPDHSVLTEDGWKRASSSEGHTRAPCRIPYGFTPDWQSTWDRSLVGRRVRLWQARNGFCQTVGEVQKAGDRRFLRLQETGNFTEKSGDTRNVKTSGVCSMALDAGPLQSPHPSGVAKLRRAWDNSMYAMARIIRGFLGRYGFQLRPGAYAGSAGQQRGLYQSELCVAPRSGTEQKPAVDTAVAVSGGVVAGLIHIQRCLRYALCRARLLQQPAKKKKRTRNTRE